MAHRRHNVRATNAVTAVKLTEDRSQNSSTRCTPYSISLFSLSSFLSATIFASFFNFLFRFIRVCRQLSDPGVDVAELSAN